MTKWEYKIQDVSMPPFPLPGPKQVEAFLNDLGAVGWELIDVNQLFMIFRRERTLDIAASISNIK